MQIANELIDPITANQTYSDEWVRSNVVPFYPATKIRYLLVGNEVLSNSCNTDLVATWPNLVPAMEKIHSSLQTQNLKSVKDLFNPVAPLEEQISESYSETLDFSGSDLIEMMVLDGCFIIEMFCKVGRIVPADSDDPLFTMALVLRLCS